MNTTRKIITSAFLASVMAAAVSLSASAEEPDTEYNADENIEIVKINEPDISNRFATNPDTIVVINESDGIEALGNSIEPRTYTFYSYTGEGTKEITDGGTNHCQSV